MRILMTLVAVVAFMASATAQDVPKEKKARKATKTEAVSTSEAAPVKAACCASKGGASAVAGKSCGSKMGKAEASTDAAPAEGTTAATEAAATKACCAGLSDAEKKACCAGKAEAHNHDHSGGGAKVEEAPEAQPNH